MNDGAAAARGLGRLQVPGLFKLTTAFVPKGDQPEAYVPQSDTYISAESFAPVCSSPGCDFVLGSEPMRALSSHPIPTYVE